MLNDELTLQPRRTIRDHEVAPESRMLTVVVMSVVLLSLVDILLAFVVRSGLPDPVRLFFVRNSMWFLGGASALVTVYSIALRATGPLVLGIATAINLFLMMQFRGPWIWVGTFDLYEQSAKPWLLALGAGVAIGYLGLLIPPVRKARPTTDEQVVSRWIIALFATTIACAFASLNSPFDSEFAPTRFIGLIGVLIAVSLVRRFAQ